MKSIEVTDVSSIIIEPYENPKHIILTVYDAGERAQIRLDLEDTIALHLILDEIIFGPAKAAESNESL